jgi:hypothetical protein
MFNEFVVDTKLDMIRLSDKQTLLQKLLYEPIYPGQYEKIRSKIFLPPEDLKKFYEKDCEDYKDLLNKYPEKEIVCKSEFKRQNFFKPVSFNLSS